MSLTATHTFEEGTNGASVVSGVNGVVALAGTPVYKTASAIHGSLGVECGSAAGVSYANGAAGTEDWYFKDGTAGAGASTLVGLRTTSTHQAKVRRSTANKFEITDNASTVQATSAVSAPSLGTPYRLTTHWTGTSSSITVYVYIYVTSLEEYQWDEVISATFTATGTVNRITVGNQSTGWVNSIDTGRQYSTQTIPVPYGAAAADNSGRPVAMLSDTGWTATGAATEAAAMADESNTTYAESGTSGSTTAVFRISQINAPTASALNLRVRGSDADTAVTATLLEGATPLGSTTRQTWSSVTVPAGPSWTDLTLTLDSGTIAAVTDWGNLWVRLAS